MAIQFATDQYKDNSVTAAKAKLDQLWSFSVAPQSAVDAANANDLVRYSQIQSLLNGIHWKESCVVATTGNITLSGTQTIDGTAVSAGQRVLVRAQSTQSENGVYECAAGAWARAGDMNSGAEFPGAAVFVKSGSTYSDKGFLCTNDTVSVGVTAVVFTEFTATVIAAGSITNTEISASAGIQLTKLESVASARILVGNASNQAAAVAMSGDITIDNAGATTIGAGVINDGKISASAAIALTKLENVTSGRIIVGNGTNKAAAVAMSGDVTIDNAGATTIGAGAINDGKISASAAIALTKLENVTSAQIIVGNASNKAAAVAMSGDISISNAGATTIAAGAVNDGKIASNAAIALSKLAAVNSGRLIVGNASNEAAAVAMSGDVTIDNAGATTIAAGAVNGSKIASNAAIALTKLESVASARILVGNASNEAAAVAMSGDISINNAGATTIADNAVSIAKVGWLPYVEAFNGTNASGYDLSRAVESSHFDGVKVYKNGQRLKKTGSPADNSEYSVANNGSGGVCKITFGANVPNTDLIVVDYIT